MTGPIPSPDVPATEFPEVAFGRSADGFPVARVADTAFAMLPACDGRHYLASGWRIGRPMKQWARPDFYGHSGELTDEAAFRARVLENAEHQREKRALGRRNSLTGEHALGPVTGRYLVRRGRCLPFHRRSWRHPPVGGAQPHGPSHATRRGRLV